MLNYVQCNARRVDKGLELVVDLFQLRLFNDIVQITAVIVNGTVYKSDFSRRT